MSIFSSSVKDKEVILGYSEPTLSQRPKRKMTPLALSLVLVASALSLSRTLYSAHATVAEKPTTSYAICSKEGQNVYTVDTANTKVECLVVEDSLVAATGTMKHVLATWPSLEVKFIAEGSILVPGISESHCHIMGYGLYRQIPLETGRNITETVSFVRDYILSNPDILNDTDKVVDGWGWDYTVWPEGRFPSAADLDADPIIKGRPVMLRSKDGHGTWVSGRVLDSIQDIPDTIEGGSIIRDEAGNPVGVFLDRAQLLLDDPVPTEQDYERRFLATVEDAHANGLTSLHDAKLDFSMLDYFKRKSETGLPIRLYGMTNYDDETTYWGNLTKPIMLTADHRFSARSVKLVGDGSMRTGGAALYEPYSDNPSSSGFMRVSEETLNRVIPWFLRDGWQVNVHAIGDRANGIVLDSLEAALEGVDVAALRPRLEHAQIMREQDMKRVGEIGVIASVQPTHVIDDMWYAEERIGPERLKGLYAFRSLLDNGARLTLGSDFPVASMNPMATFYAAITRVSLEGTSPQGPGGFFPEQRLTRLEALRGMTIDPAYASFTESVLGSLEPGKHADFVVLSQDIMDIPVTSILDTKVLATVIDGKPIYGTI